MSEEKIQLNVGELQILARKDPHPNLPPARGKERKEYAVRFIRSGRVRRAGNTLANIEIPAEPIRSAIAAGLFDARASFLDHSGWFEYPSLRDLVGVTSAAEWNEAEQSAEGIIRLYENPAAQVLADLLDGVLADAGAGEPVPDISLSLVFWPRWAPRDNEDDPLRLAEFRHIESVDFVFEPAADGRVKQAIRRVSQPVNGNGAVEAYSASATRQVNLSSIYGGLEMENNMDQQDQVEEGLPENPGAGHTPQEALTPALSPAGRGSPDEWLASLQQAGTQALLASSGLPAASQERLASQHFHSPQAVSEAIQDERRYLAELYADQVVQLGGLAPRASQIQMGHTGLEQLQLAAEALFAGERPQDGIQPLSGIRELYTLLSGDYEMTGLFHSERVRFANVNSSTMAGLVANALNKRVVNLFQQYPRWWEPIVSEEDFSSLQSARWVTLGGVGELPTVAEGAAYTELSWDDNTETASFIKKGGYLGLTIESIDKDDTRKIQAAPRALAQSAWLTLGKAVSAIFTANSGAGPTLADGTALFDATRGNLGSTALSFSSYTAARLAMRKMSELNSGERLGILTAPRYLVVPPDLEITALQIFAGEQQPAQANYLENPLAEGNYHEARMNAARRRVVVVDLWTDTNNWAAVADPRLYATIGIGFRYGRVPEIFSVASPTAGLMFTNDTMPVKVRFFFAVGPMDYRGFYKANVA